MKKLIIFLLLWAGVASATTAFEPYVVRNNVRTAEETVRQLEGSTFLWEFQKELQANTSFQFGHLTKAVEDGALVSRRCGNCRLETAGLRNGKTVYHRHVEAGEVVAYLNGIPLFLPACGNPVRPLRTESVVPAPPVVQQVPQPVVQPTPQPPPTPPPPQARKETPEQSPEGCTPDQVSYSTDEYRLPSIVVPVGRTVGVPVIVETGSIPWTTSHHHWRCVENISETEE